MGHFSDNLDEKEIPIAELNAHGWLRFRYEDEILNYFLCPEDQSLEKPPLATNELFVGLCFELSLRQPMIDYTDEGDRRYFIHDYIRTKRGYQFFDLIEIVGDILAVTDRKAKERYQQAVEEYGDDDEWVSDLSIETVIKLKSFGFDTYVQKVNSLFSETYISYFLDNDGRIHSIDNPDASFSLAREVYKIVESKQASVNSESTLSTPEVDTILDLINNSQFVDDENRQSVRTSSQLFKEKKYQDVLRILFPSIEAIINKYLVIEGVRPDKFTGLAKKVEWLESNGSLPPDLSKTVGIIYPRNLISHGDYSPPKQLLEPLCVLAFRYIIQLLTRYKHDGAISL